MHRLARRTHAAKRLVGLVGLRIDDARLDVPEAVVARITLASDVARVQVAPAYWSRKRHDV
jgi:hypothetical protein